MKKSKIILSLFLIIAFSGGITYFVHEVIAFTPSTEEEVAAWRKDSKGEKFDWTLKDVSFNTFTDSISGEGSLLKISGLLAVANNIDNNEDAPTVIALHGKGSNRIGVLRFGYMFYRAGFNVLIYDQRHHGRSEGEYTTYGYYESYDVKAAIEFLESQNLNTENLGIIGESFGAATAIMAGAIEEKIDFVIADSSYTDMPNAVKDNAWRMNYVPHYPIPDIGFAIAGVIADFNPWQVSPLNALEDMNKPVLIVHCDQDEWAYPKYAHRLYEVANKELTDFRMFENCKHVAAYDDYPDEYEKMVESFLTKHSPDFSFQAHIESESEEMDGNHEAES